MKVDQALAEEHGLKPEEYSTILKILDRVPTLTELAIYSALWSEHCSYKSSRIWLKTLPTEAPWVIQGPGENAGVIDIGDGQAAVFKMESHNHPSFIEPYQGAMSGVGGIMRDVFTMGARPIANLNALRFGAPDHPKTRHLVAGVVAGIGDYGNCMGVPTVGGETNFYASYNGNILVNAMTVGIARKDRIFYSKAEGVGNSVVYVGAKTGRDGIHGASMASDEFSENSEHKRPTVQVGDPFTEKLLLEACLELMETGLVLAIQDMGAAGLTSSAFEMADKGGLGMTLNLDNVPLREDGMTPYEIMLSESQERMLMVIRPENETVARQIFEKWELDFATIGTLTDTKRLIVKMGGDVHADLEIAPLVDQAPVYERAFTKTPKQDSPPALPVCADIIGALENLLSSPNLCSKKWITEQYDSLVRGQTVEASMDAAVVRLAPGKALAMSSDCTPRYCLADPYEGGKQAVAECWRNLTAVGAVPMAVTNNLNFGNPEKPDIMGQFVGCIEGLADACRALDFPVVSGNVSLYNETKGVAILPTPVIGGVGLVSGDAMDFALKAEGEGVFLIGETKGHLEQSLYAQYLHKNEAGRPPPVDLELEKKNGAYVQHLIKEKKITACHDISDGGLLVALAEMMMEGDLGVEITYSPTLYDKAAFWFGEDQARYLVTSPVDLQKDGVMIRKLGHVRGDLLKLPESKTISVARLRDHFERWLLEFMSGG